MLPRLVNHIARPQNPEKNFIYWNSALRADKNQSFKTGIQRPLRAATPATPTVLLLISLVLFVPGVLLCGFVYIIWAVLSRESIPYYISSLLSSLWMIGLFPQSPPLQALMFILMLLAFNCVIFMLYYRLRHFEPDYILFLKLCGGVPAALVIVSILVKILR